MVTSAPIRLHAVHLHPRASRQFSFSTGCDRAVIWLSTPAVANFAPARGRHRAGRNPIPEVGVILVGHADDPRLASGVSVIIFEEPAVVAVDVRGGAPATRDTDLLEPHRT